MNMQIEVIRYLDKQAIPTTQVPVWKQVPTGTYKYLYKITINPHYHVQCLLICLIT